MNRVLHEKYSDSLLSKAKELVYFSESFPTFVFQVELCRFLFFSVSDHLFARTFMDISKEILRLERSEVISIVNVEETERNTQNTAAMIYLDRNSDGDAFRDALIQRDSSGGWYMAGDSYVCMSHTCDWVIYGEQIPDIAVVGFRDQQVFDELKDVFYKMGARPLNELLVGGQYECAPFSYLIEDFREQLLLKYPFV